MAAARVEEEQEMRDEVESLASISSSGSYSSTEDDDQKIENLWLVLRHRLHNRTSSIWKKSVHSLTTNHQVQDELLQAEQADQARLEYLLDQRQTVLTDAVRSIREKYKGKKGQIQTRIRREKERVREFFHTVVQEEKDRIKRAVKEKSDRINIVIEDNIDAWVSHFGTPKMIRATDRVAFFIGVMLICVIEAILLRYPSYMKNFYLYTIFPLMLIRYCKYHQVKYHYFLLDFCYFIQIVLIYFLLSDPSNRFLFESLFILSNGPLMMAVVLWQNSIVFHSLDKVTSSYIHILPSLVTYCIRWHPSTETEHVLASKDVLSYTDAFIYPMMVYMSWQMGYLAKTEWYDREKLDNDESISTSFRYLQKLYKNTALYTVASWFGPTFLLPMFVLLQFAFTLVTALPTLWMYQSNTFHAAYIGFIFAASIWNAANYYVYKFPKHQGIALSKEVKAREESWYRTYFHRGSHSNNVAIDPPEDEKELN